MNRGKHSARAKHLDTNTQKNSKYFKSILKILIAFITIIIVYSIYDIYLKNLSIFDFSTSETHFDDNLTIYEPSEKVETETFLTVNGAEYLQITGVYINSDNPELSTVSARLKNNSNQSYENVNLRISLCDEHNNEITFLDYKIDKIEANGEVSTFAASKKDLSNCVNYSIALKKSP